MRIIGVQGRKTLSSLYNIALLFLGYLEKGGRIGKQEAMIVSFTSHCVEHVKISK